MNKAYTAITAATLYALTMFYNANAAEIKTQTTPKQQNNAQQTEIKAENPTIIKIKGIGKALVYQVDPKYTEVKTNVSKTTTEFEDFIGIAKKKYNGGLEFIVTGGFFDRKTGKSIGPLVNNHNLITNGVSIYGTNFIYDDGKAYLVDNYAEFNFKKYETGVGGLARILRNGLIAIDSTLKRNINPHAEIGRQALGITYPGKIILVSYTGSVQNLAKVMKELHCKDAVQLDSGSSRALWVNGNILKQPVSRLKSVIVGVKRKYILQKK